MDPPSVIALPERFAEPEPIGHGAQGITYAAFDTKLQRRVAVKVLALARVQDWKAFERFERECRVLASIEHPGVPRYLDHFADEPAGIFVLVMELVDGRSLARDIAEQRRRTHEQLVDLLDQLLAILQHLHELHPRVIHRDVKPGNVIQRADGRVVLVDFGGVARPFATKGGSTMIGTFGYMAPEQLYGKATAATDLYALGATIAAVAAGVEGEELPRRGHAIDLDEIVSPGPLRTTLEAMLAVDPDERPASAAEARAMLHGTRARLPARVERSLPARRDAPGALARATPRQRAAVIGTITAGAMAAAITRAPMVLITFAAALVVIFVIISVKQGRD